jgi:WhiB family transcriptional regulator, redox-sensing transcriptional regulator
MNTAWLDDAACTEVGTDLFFSDVPGDRPAAQRFCRTHCKVQMECLEAAMRDEEGQPRNQRFGIRGAITPSQRDRLARGERRPDHVVVGAAVRVLPMLAAGMPTAEIAAQVGISPDSVRRIRREHMAGVTA